jgi:CHASE3 domain sensor protein
VSAGRRDGPIRDRDVEALYGLVTDASYDARVVAAELAAFCADERRYRHVGADFSPVADWRRQLEPSLVELLRKSGLTRADNIVASEATARESVANLASVMISKVNLRMGRAVFRLTWVALVAGELALVVAIIALALS